MRKSEKELIERLLYRILQGQRASRQEMERLFNEIRTIAGLETFDVE